MSTTLLYALIMAITQIVLILISYFAGFQTDHMSSGRWFQILFSTVASIVILIIGIKAVREERPGKGLSYGRGVGTGCLITLYSCIIGSIYTYIHFTYINPSFVDYIIDAARVDWASKGLTESQMQGGEKFLHWLFKPAVQSISYFLIGNVFGLIFSLIISAFLKREPIESASVTA